jgi:hypothetical protein
MSGRWKRTDRTTLGAVAVLMLEIPMLKETVSAALDVDLAAVFSTSTSGS